MIAAPVSHHRVCVAPMLGWTDRHCRYFHRLLTLSALLYTEMLTTGALLHGDAERHLQHHAQEGPVALQLGGADPVDLARCASLAERWGYAEINLNCGCPSVRVQQGAFGASLMRRPHQVADAIKAMRDTVSIPVTVKHRTGIDQEASDEFVLDFVGILHEAGCDTFIVHARNAWLQGLGTKDNRKVPPLRVETVYRIKRAFPHLRIVINGEIQTSADIRRHLQHVDGVMLGRAAYHQPWQLSTWDADFFGNERSTTREMVEAQMVDYMIEESALTPWPLVARHILGLRHGLPGARRWRQVWSDPAWRNEPPDRVMRMAHGEPARN